LDETFVLESYKVKEMAKDFWRKPRLHGAIASKPGLSDEQVCICTGIDYSGFTIAESVNRATPTSDELAKVFSGRINKKALAI
jgi:hypothetical protein